MPIVSLVDDGGGCLVCELQEFLEHIEILGVSMSVEDGRYTLTYGFDLDTNLVILEGGDLHELLGYFFDAMREVLGDDRAKDQTTH